MTLDEAIAHEREATKEQKSKYDKCQTRTRYNCAMCFHNPKCDEDAKEHEQLAEWLKELKAYKSDDFTKNLQTLVYKQGYNKAIEDFVKEISESNKGHWRPTKYEHGEVVSETMSYDIGTIRLIAEQLKAGGENEQR